MAFAALCMGSRPLGRSAVEAYSLGVRSLDDAARRLGMDWRKLALIRMRRPLLGLGRVRGSPRADPASAVFLDVCWTKRPWCGYGTLPATYSVAGRNFPLERDVVVGSQTSLKTGLLPHVLSSFPGRLPFSILTDRWCGASSRSACIAARGHRRHDQEVVQGSPWRYDRNRCR